MSPGRVLGKKNAEAKATLKRPSQGNASTVKRHAKDARPLVKRPSQANASTSKRPASDSLIETFSEDSSSGNVHIYAKPAMMQPVELPVSSWVVAFTFYNSLGSLEYKNIAQHDSIQHANSHVKECLYKWKEEDARPICEEQVRHLDGTEHAQAIQDLVRKHVHITTAQNAGLLMITACINGLDTGGSSNYWRWQSLPTTSDIPEAARTLYVDVQGGGSTEEAPNPELFLGD